MIIFGGEVKAAAWMTARDLAVTEPRRHRVGTTDVESVEVGKSRAGQEAAEDAAKQSRAVREDRGPCEFKLAMSALPVHEALRTACRPATPPRLNPARSFALTIAIPVARRVSNSRWSRRSQPDQSRSARDRRDPGVAPGAVLAAAQVPIRDVTVKKLP